MLCVGVIQCSDFVWCQVELCGVYQFVQLCYVGGVGDWCGDVGMCYQLGQGYLCGCGVVGFGGGIECGENLQVVWVEVFVYCVVV